MNDSRSAFLADAQQTEAFARALGVLCTGGERIALTGEMGAGKTTFVRGLASGLGIDPLEVSSPTFTLIHVHENDGKDGVSSLVHVDAFRLENASELTDLGWSDLLTDERNVMVVEWPQKLASSLGEGVLKIELFHAASKNGDSAGREIVISSTFPDALKRQLFTSCRTCGRPMHAGVRSFPFCGNKCRMADLGNWFDGKYSVSREIEEDDLYDSDLS
jgi:tRNA threonylcarbamoyladenosine biosynthesis protein TsaE